MKLNLTRSVPFGLAALLFLLTAAAAVGQGANLKFQAVLVWATNEDASPNPGHKPVSAELRKELVENLPLKWKNYFEVNRKELAVAKRGSGEVSLSDKCRIRLKDIDGKSVEVSLIGKGEPVLTRIQPLPNGKTLVLGGNAPNSTGWLVVLKRVE